MKLAVISLFSLYIVYIYIICYVYVFVYMSNNKVEDMGVP